MSPPAKRNSWERVNLPLLQNSDSESHSRFTTTTQFNNPSKSGHQHHENPPPYAATMPEPNDNIVGGNTATQTPFALTMNPADMQLMTGENQRLREESQRLQGENANANVRERSERYQKRVFLAFIVVLFILWLFTLGALFVSFYGFGWPKSNDNVKTTNQS